MLRTRSNSSIEIFFSENNLENMKPRQSKKIKRSKMEVIKSLIRPKAVSTRLGKSGMLSANLKSKNSSKSKLSEMTSKSLLIMSLGIPIVTSLRLTMMTDLLTNLVN